MRIRLGLVCFNYLKSEKKTLLGTFFSPCRFLEKILNTMPASCVCVAAAPGRFVFFSTPALHPDRLTGLEMITETRTHVFAAVGAGSRTAYKKIKIISMAAAVATAAATTTTTITTTAAATTTAALLRIEPKRANRRNASSESEQIVKARGNKKGDKVSARQAKQRGLGEGVHSVPAKEGRYSFNCISRSLVAAARCSCNCSLFSSPHCTWAA